MATEIEVVDRLYLLGTFRLERAGRPRRLPTRKIEALLAYLILQPGPQPREKLAALFWGDSPDEQARGSLRKALTLLRQTFEADFVLADRQTVQLNPDYGLWVDALEFRRAATGLQHPAVGPAPDPLPPALNLYQGDLLPDFYDDWLWPWREQLRGLYLETLLGFVQAMRTASRYEQAIELAQKVLTADPANERAHQHLMFCYIAAGNRPAALTQYESCVRLLQQELAVAPMPATTALYRWIKQAPPARTATEALITNLPIPLSSFIGRSAETTTIKAWFTGPGSAIRLVTLTGPGGSGKTRLAVQTATDLIDVFADGVWWVALAPLADEIHLPQALAKTLGVQEVAQEPLTVSLTAFLQPRRLLLVLDNCEHLVAACAALVQDLLGQCPQLYLLATSREALGIAGEQLLPVPSLAVPQPAALSLTGLLLQFEGIRLFVERAQAIEPAFALTEANAPFVAQVCARLDGIPLAIELAATRVKSLAVADIAARLDDRFTLLTLGSRVAPPRHQTLRAVLDWSYELLAEAERLLFQRLSVFAGRFTLELAEAVCAATAAVDPVTPARCLDLVGRLVDKSLVVVEQMQGRSGYRLLETIRAYAADRLNASAEVEAVRQRHLTCLMQLAETAEIELRGPAQSRWLVDLDMMLDNVRAALAWSLVRDSQSGLRLAGALAWYWNMRGYWWEGMDWLSRLLGQSAAAVPTAARARALTAAGNLACWGSNDYPQAQAWLAESIAIYRHLGRPERWGLGFALSLYGEVLICLNERALAQTALDESLSLAEGLGEAGVWVAGWALLSLSNLASEPAEQQARLERSAALFHHLGDQAQYSVVLAHLAWCYIGQKAYVQAEAAAIESLRLTEQTGDPVGMAWMYKLLGDLWLAQADYQQARAHYLTALDRFRSVGSKSGIGWALFHLGESYLLEGSDLAQTRTLWQEALPLLEQIGHKEIAAHIVAQLARFDLPLNN